MSEMNLEIDAGLYAASPFYSRTSSPRPEVIAASPKEEPVVDQSRLDDWWYRLGRIQDAIEDSSDPSLVDSSIELDGILREIYGFLR